MLPGMVKTPCAKIRLCRESVQKQNGATDCGVFALANLVEVLCGGDPRKAKFDQKRMREHLFKCLSQQIWELFPKQAEAVQKVHDNDRFKSFSVSATLQTIDIVPNPTPQTMNPKTLYSHRENRTYSH